MYNKHEYSAEYFHIPLMKDTVTPKYEWTKRHSVLSKAN